MYSPLGSWLHWKTDYISVRYGCIGEGFAEQYDPLGFLLNVQTEHESGRLSFLC